MMKNVLNLYYFCIYFKKRPKNDLVLFRFVLYTPQGLKTYQSCRRSFQVNSFRVLADSDFRDTTIVSSIENMCKSRPREDASRVGDGAGGGG